MNLVLGDVVETIYVVDEDDEEDDVKVSHHACRLSISHYTRLYHGQTTTKKSEMLFVRGRF